MTNSGTLSNTGATTLGNTLSVAGQSTTNGIGNTGLIANTGNMTNSGTLSNIGATTLGNTLSVAGQSTTNGIGNTGLIANTGNITNTGTLTNTGNATIGGTLTQTGLAVFNGNIQNNGTIASTGNVTSAATVQGATLASTGATNVGTNLAVGGNSAVTGNSTVGGTLAVTGTTTTKGISNNGDLTNTGNITTASLTTTGAVSGNSVSAGAGGLTSDGPTVLNGSVTVAVGQAISMGGNRVRNVAAPIAGDDAANKTYVDTSITTAFTNYNDRLNETFAKIDHNTQGIAIAIAMGGLSLPSDKHFALAANLGFYDGKQAFALQSALKLGDGLVFNAGAGMGFGGDSKVGARVGVTAAW